MTRDISNRKIRLVGRVCTQAHGNSDNEAEVYGHYGSNRTCIRIGKTWVYDIARAPKKKEND